MSELPQTPPATAAPSPPVEVGGPASVEPPLAKKSFLIVVTVLSLAADLGTKQWAKTHLSGMDPRHAGAKRLEIWKDHVDLIFAQNPGGAWSFLRSLPDDLRRPFFLVVSAAAIVFIVTVYERVRKNQWAMKWGLPLALGGAMGNLADRIRYGWVVDFVDVFLKKNGTEHHWPTFNVADIAIVVGVGLMAVDMIVSRKPKAAHAGPSSGRGLSLPTPPAS